MAETQDVRMPDGTVIPNVPKGTTKAELRRKYAKYQGIEDPDGIPVYPNLPTGRQPLQPGQPFRQLKGAVSEAITGAKRNPENIPELERESPVELFGLKDRLAFAKGNPLAQASIFEEQTGQPVDFDPVSGLPFTVDEQGNKAFINRPGFSGQDLQDILLETATILGAERLGRMAPGGVLGRSAATGAGVAGGEIAMDKVAQVLGSDQPVDQKRAALLGLFAAGGEVAAPILNKFLGTISRSGRFVSDGQLTEEGRRLIQDAGLPEEAITPDVIEIFRRSPSMDADQLSRQAAAQTLPEPVPLRQAQITQRGSDARLEADIQRGTFGDEVAEQFDRQTAQQQNLLRSNAEILQDRLGAGEPVEELGQGAQRAARGLQDRAQEARTGINQAFDEAKSFKVRTPRDTIVATNRAMQRELVEEGFPIEGAVQTSLNEFNEFAQKNIRNVDLKTLQNWRTKTSRRRRAALKNPERAQEAEALRRMISEFDENVEQGLTSGLIEGGEEAISAWKNAIGLRRQFAENFDATKDLIRLRERDITQKDAANYLLGLGKVGQRKEAIKTAQALKNVVGEDSPAWRGVKQETFMQLLRNQPESGWSAAKFRTAVNQFFKEQPELSRVIFDPEERGMIQKLKFVSDLTIDKPGARNPSTPNVFVSLIGRLAGKSGDAIARGVEGTMRRSPVGRAFAEQAFEGRPETTRFFDRGGSVGAAAGALANPSTDDNPQTTPQ